MTLVWVSIVLALLIVACAVGYPYWRTHRRMRDHYDKREASAYLDAKDQAAEGVLPQQPERSERQVSVGTRPVGQPSPAGQPGPAGQTGPAGQARAEEQGSR